MHYTIVRSSQGQTKFLDLYMYLQVDSTDNKHNKDYHKIHKESIECNWNLGLQGIKNKMSLMGMNEKNE